MISGVNRNTNDVNQSVYYYYVHVQLVSADLEHMGADHRSHSMCMFEFNYLQAINLRIQVATQIKEHPLAAKIHAHQISLQKFN